MADPQLILLLHLLGEGGGIEIKADEASLTVPVYRESNEVYELEEDDTDISLHSTITYADFRAYWSTFTESTRWYLLYPQHIHRCLFDLVRDSLSQIDTAVIGRHAVAGVQRWLDAISENRTNQ